MLILHKFFYRLAKEGISQFLLHGQCNFDTKTQQEYEKKKHMLTSFMKIDVKILNKWNSVIYEKGSSSQPN